MQSEYKGYYLEEGEGGAVYVYDSVEAWRERNYVYIGDNEYLAKLWVDLLVGDATVSVAEPLSMDGDQEPQPLGEAVKKLPFMPEPGPRVPPFISEEIYGLRAFEAPISEYGRALVDMVSSALEEFIGVDFVVVRKFDETGWASDSVMYAGELKHVPTGSVWLVELGVSFEWRKPEEVDVMYTGFLATKNPDGSWNEIPEEALYSEKLSPSLSAEGGREASRNVSEYIGRGLHLVKHERPPPPPRKQVRDRHTGIVYSSKTEAGKVVAHEYGIEPGPFAWYVVLKKDPDRFEEV